MDNNSLRNMKKESGQAPAPQNNEVLTPPAESVKPAGEKATAAAKSLRKMAEDRAEEKAKLAQIADNKQKRMKIIFFVIGGLALACIIALIVMVIVFGGKDDVIDTPPEVTEPVVVSMYDPAAATKDLTANSPKVDYPEGIREEFKPLYAYNTDFVGWVSVPGTCIDTAVYQAKDNNYYIKGDIKGNWSRYGTPYLDFRNDKNLGSRNTTIIAHNFDDDKDGEFDDLIFGDIEKYLDVEFYKTHPLMTYKSRTDEYTAKIIACFLTNGDSTGDTDHGDQYLFNVIASDMCDECFMKYIDEINSRSFIHTTVDIEPTDKIITLLTCSYQWDRGGALQNVRCILVARVCRPGELLTVDTSGATQNEDPQYPQLYYDIFGGTNPHRNDDRWYPY